MKEEPTRRSFNRQEIIDEARRWVNLNYREIHLDNPDKFYERLGLLVDFVTDIVPGDEKP